MSESVMSKCYEIIKFLNGMECQPHGGILNRMEMLLWHAFEHNPNDSTWEFFFCRPVRSTWGYSV